MSKKPTDTADAVKNPGEAFKNMSVTEIATWMQEQRDNGDITLKERATLIDNVARRPDDNSNNGPNSVRNKFKAALENDTCKHFFNSVPAIPSWEETHSMNTLMAAIDKLSGSPSLHR